MKTKAGNLSANTIFWKNDDSYFVVTGRDEISGAVYAQEFDNEGALISQEAEFHPHDLVETENYSKH